MLKTLYICDFPGGGGSRPPCPLSWIWALQGSIHVYLVSSQQLTNIKVESQITLQRAIVEERKKKDLAISQAVAQVRADMGEKGDPGITVVTYEAWNQAQGQGQIMMVEEAHTKDGH